jgi:hypothetical protein
MARGDSPIFVGYDSLRRKVVNRCQTRISSAWICCTVFSRDWYILRNTTYTKGEVFGLQIQKSYSTLKNQILYYKESKGKSLFLWLCTAVLRSWSRKEPHLLVVAGAVTRCGSGSDGSSSDNGIKHG